MIDIKLIERALSLTGKTYEQFMEYHMSGPEFGWYRFCYYLLSPEFIEKYLDGVYQYAAGKWERMGVLSKQFGQAIYEYQYGREQPLIELLEKI